MNSNREQKAKLKYLILVPKVIFGDQPNAQIHYSRLNLLGASNMNDSAAIIPPITYYNKKIAYQQLYLQKLIAEPPLAIVRRMYGPS